MEHYIKLSYTELDSLVRRAVRDGIREYNKEQKLKPLRKAIFINEAAEELGVDRSTVYKMIKSGELKTVLLGKRQKVTMASIELAHKRIK